MVKEIYWSNLAKIQLTNILKYYHYKAGNKYANQLLDKIIHATTLLQANPRLGFTEPSLKKYAKNYRSLIEGYYKIIYTEEIEAIRIVTIFDCWQNPEKLKDFL